MYVWGVFTLIITLVILLKKVLSEELLHQLYVGQVVSKCAELPGQSNLGPFDHFALKRNLQCVQLVLSRTTGWTQRAGTVMYSSEKVLKRR